MDKIYKILGTEGLAEFIADHARKYFSEPDEQEAFVDRIYVRTMHKLKEADIYEISKYKAKKTR